MAQGQEDLELIIQHTYDQPHGSGSVGCLSRLSQHHPIYTTKFSLILCIGTKILPIAQDTFQEVVGGAGKLLVCASYVRMRVCSRLCAKIFIVQKICGKNFHQQHALVKLAKISLGKNFHSICVDIYHNTQTLSRRWLK